MINFGFIKTAECINTAPVADTRCSDPAFALANPDICPAKTVLILKPSVALVCALGSVQFKAYLSVNGTEQDVTDETTFTTSDLSVAIIGAASGNCTGVAQGDVTVAASYEDYTATAVLHVMGASGSSCCDSQAVSMMLLVDTSRSMSQAFSGDYETKLAFAKAAAAQFISEVNDTKDTVGLMSFNGSTVTVIESPTSDTDAVEALVPSIAQTQQKTAFYAALKAAIDELNATTTDLRVIVLISDGRDTSDGAANGYAGTDNPLALLTEFKEQGGIVICLGCRASGVGFSLLSAFATGGFFVNSFSGIEAASLTYLSGLKGYICAGNCAPNGDTMEATPSLDYAGFANWDVIGGTVDLKGPGLFDLIPGSGLFVDLAGTTLPCLGRMVSKTPFSLTSGHSYRIAVDLAGNQRIQAWPFSALLKVFYLNGSVEIPLVNQVISITYWRQQWTNYAFTFVAPADVDVYISIQQNEQPNCANYPNIPDCVRMGLLLNCVQFDDTTDAINLLTDDFETENMQYVPPKCGLGSVFVSGGYASGYNCYGEGCLSSPPVEEFPDPSPLPDIESGYTPPKEYTSTREACASCDEGTVNLPETPLQDAVVLESVPTGAEPGGIQEATSLIPTMTGPSAPSGLADASSEQSTVNLGTQYAWRAFAQSDVPWSPTDMNTPPWIRYTFDSPATVGGYGLVCLAGSGDSATPYSWRFQGSDDWLTWTTLDSQVGTELEGYPTLNKFTIQNPGSYQQYRLLILSTLGGDIPVIYQVQMYGFSGASVVDYFTSLTYDLGEAVAISAYRVTSSYQFCPTAGWSVHGSTDGTTWVSVADVYAPPFPSFSNVPQSGLFPVMGTTPYRYYRFTVTTREDSVGSGINSVEFYGAALAQECATATRTSDTAQSASDLAYSDAMLLAQASLNCQTLYSATENYTAKCPVGTYGGGDQQRTATGYSLISIDHAIAEATAAAKELAEAALNCTGDNSEQAITILDNTSATPYPSVKFVSGYSGLITKVTVAITGFSHTYPHDVDLVLRGPDGTSVLLMRGVGAAVPVGPIDFTIDDFGVPMPLAAALADGSSYSPTQSGLRPDLLPPGPASPYGVALSDFNGKSPNGAWSLWAVDWAYLNAGSIAGGWTLIITTA